MAGTNRTLGGGGFHHVAVRVADVEKSIRVYGEVMGFKEKVRWGEGEKTVVLLDTGDGNYVELFAGGPTPPRANVSDIASEGPIIHLAFRTTDVDGCIARARAAGLAVTKEPKEVTLESRPFALPVRLAFFRGLDGEMIELFKNELT